MALSGFHHHITWSEFRHENESPDPPHLANTSAPWGAQGNYNITGSGGSYHIVPNSLHVVIRMDSQASWCVNGQTSASLLRHEQGHYDISAIAGRQYHQGLLAIRGTDPDDVNAQADSLRSAVQSAVDDKNARYDDATDHGMIAGAQATWQQAIRGRARQSGWAGAGSALARQSVPANALTCPLHRGWIQSERGGAVRAPQCVGWVLVRRDGDSPLKSTRRQKRPASGGRM